jgi:hypothetical protein
VVFMILQLNTFGSEKSLERKRGKKGRRTNMNPMKTKGNGDYYRYSCSMAMERKRIPRESSGYRDLVFLLIQFFQIKIERTGMNESSGVSRGMSESERAGTTAIYVWIYLPRAKVMGDDSTAFLYLAPLALRTLRVKDSVMIIVAFFVRYLTKWTYDRRCVAGKEWNVVVLILRKEMLRWNLTGAEGAVMKRNVLI